MRTHEALLRYFLMGTAEEDRSFLDRAFITYEQLETIVSIDPGTMKILIGNKGIGKSALFEWLAKMARNRGLPVLLLRPDNLDLTNIGQQADIATLKRGFYEALVHATVLEIGRQLRGLLTGPSAALYNEAVKAGARDPDFVGKALTVISTVSKPVTQINGVALAKDLAGNRNSDALVRSVTQHLLSAGTVLFLLLDDTDQVSAPNSSSQLNRIWALLLAMRRLAGESLPLRCIVSLRSEVWARLETESAGQRDQTDHLRSMVVRLRADDALMERIILRRLELAADDLGQRRVDPYGVFFQGVDVALPTSDERRPWNVLLVKSARERPRDAIQFVRILTSQAQSQGHEKIGDEDVNDGMKQYSLERVNDAANEFAGDCKELRRVFESFAETDFELPFEAVREHLSRVGSGFTLVLRDAVIKPDNDEDAIRLLHFLHETGFLNPRVGDNRQSKGYRHITFQDDPYFVTKSNWNKLQAATWEIHPAFRSYLIAIGADLKARRSRRS